MKSVSSWTLIWIERSVAMVSRFRISAVAGMLVVGLLAVSFSSAAKRKRPIRRLTFDPTAEKVEMFDGIDNGTIEVKMIPKSSLQGTNLWDSLLRS